MVDVAILDDGESGLHQTRVVVSGVVTGSDLGRFLPGKGDSMAAEARRHLKPRECRLSDEGFTAIAQVQFDGRVDPRVLVEYTCGDRSLLPKCKHVVSGGKREEADSTMIGDLCIPTTLTLRNLRSLPRPTWFVPVCSLSSRMMLQVSIFLSFQLLSLAPAEVDCAKRASTAFDFNTLP